MNTRQEYWRGKLPDAIAVAAVTQFGTPNDSLTTKSKLRFGTNGSVAVELEGDNAGAWFDHESNEGGYLTPPQEACRKKMTNSRTSNMVDLHKEERRAPPEAIYDYHDADGELVFQVVRFPDKRFKQRRPNGKGGYEWNLKGVRRVLYRLSRVLAADIVFVVEGEKDVDNLAALLNDPGLAVTTCPQGAGKWQKSYSETLRGKNVVLFGDNDDAGREHARTVANSLVGLAGRIRIADLPGLPEKGDISDWIEAGGTRDELREIVKNAPEHAPKSEEGAKLTLDPKDPVPSARIFLGRNFMTDGRPTLLHHAGEYLGWNGSAYSVIDAAAIRADVYNFLEPALHMTEKVPFKPTSKKVNDVVDALAAVANLPSTTTAPTWLDGRTDPDPSEIVACANGLLHLPTLDLLPATPMYFNRNAVDFDYDADALDPVNWLRFLNQLWAGDPEAIDTLQEIFGYALTSDTRQQKIFLFDGPKRSGKGTIGRVLTPLLGRDNVCAPTLAGLQTRFGLQSLIGRQLAIISDARLGGRTDQHAITERLLSISGEDGITVDRKYLPAWTGRLSTRFLILTNELPRLADASGALASRFIVLTLRESFYGREDLGLIDRLLGELPGIFNWALDGWRRLNERGHFIQPTSSQDAIDELRDLGSPIGAFVRDRCSVGPGNTVECAILFARWREWCEEQGRDHPGTAQTFGRDLRAAVPSLTTVQHRNQRGKPTRYFEGIALG